MHASDWKIVSLPLVVFSLLLSCHRHQEDKVSGIKKAGANTLTINDLSLIQLVKLEKKAFPVLVDLPGKIAISDQGVFGAGTLGQPGDKTLNATHLGAYLFQAELTPERAAKLKRGQLVTFDDFPPMTAKVESVGAATDSAYRLIKVRCLFKGKLPSSIPQGTLLKAHVQVEQVESLVGPVKALVHSNGKDYVFVRKVGALPFFHRVPVQLVAKTGSGIVIAPNEEVTSGSEVVSDGASLLNSILEEP